MDEPKLTDPLRAGWQTLEGKLTVLAVSIAGSVLMKLTGIDFGLLFRGDPVEQAKAVDKAAASISSMAESYKAVANTPAEFAGVLKFGMILLFIAYVVTRYIDRRYRLKKDMLNARAAEIQQ